MQDLENVIADIENEDILEYVRKQRPNTKWHVHSVVSTSFYLALLPNFPIGGCCTDLPFPKHVMENKAIVTLLSNNHKTFHDNLCFFRCLALHHGQTETNLEKYTSSLFRQWSNDSIDNFEGVSLVELGPLETLFETNIDVFAYQDMCLIPVRRSDYKHKTTMRLLLVHDSHFCFIKCIDSVCRAFGCPKCGKTWHTNKALVRHEAACNGDKVKRIYPGGVYHPTPSPLDVLLDMGVPVDPSFVYPYRATFDFETYFCKKNLPSTKVNGGTIYTAKHKLLSIGACSNVEGYTDPKCWIKDTEEQDPQQMVDAWIDTLELMSDKAFNILSNGHFKKAYVYINEVKEKESQQKEIDFSQSDKMESILYTYLHQLPVVGFNSGNFDLNVIKPYFVRRLLLKDQDDEAIGESKDDDNECETPTVETKSKKAFVVKKNNNFICVSTSKLKFLDIKNFIAPGFNYSKYLAAYGVTEQKGFFPYEYIDSLERLNEPLPPHESFFSSLKKQNISLKEYEYIQTVFAENKMKSLRDLLEWYQIKDVVPFLEALKRASAFYEKELGLDMLKDGLSVPGLTLRYLFKTLPPHVYFSLIGENDKDLHETMRKNIVGGPAIVFHRYHSKHKTFIRGNPDKVVETITGFDANALYQPYAKKCQRIPQPGIHPTTRVIFTQRFKVDMVIVLEVGWSG